MFLQPLNIQEGTVPHLKDLIHIFLNTQRQGLADLADYFQPPTLTSDIFAASLPTRVYSISFERSD